MIPLNLTISLVKNYNFNQTCTVTKIPHKPRNPIIYSPITFIRVCNKITNI